MESNELFLCRCSSARQGLLVQGHIRLLLCILMHPISDMIFELHAISCVLSCCLIVQRILIVLHTVEEGQQALNHHIELDLRREHPIRMMPAPDVHQAVADVSVGGDVGMPNLCEAFHLWGF